MTLELYANDPAVTGLAWSTLSAGYIAGATSAHVTANAPYPGADPTATPATVFRVRFRPPAVAGVEQALDPEILLVTDSRTTTWTVAGAQEGSTAANHASGCTVEVLLTKAALLAQLTVAEAYTDTQIAVEAATRATADTTNATAISTETTRATTAEGTKQPLDADLTAIAALDSSTAGGIWSDGAGWLKKTASQIKTALGLVKADVGLGNVDNTSDVNKPVSTAQQTALDGKVAKAGDTMTGLLTLSGPPTSSLHATTKTYVDAETTRASAAEATNAAAISTETTRAQAAEAAITAGLQFKAARVVATTNQTRSGLPTVDGITLSSGDLILLVGQTAGSQNGLWAVASGSWTRPSNYAAGSDATAVSVWVEDGTTNKSSIWVVAGSPPNVVDTNVVTFQQASGLGEITVGSGLVKTGNNLSVDPAVVELVSAALQKTNNLSDLANPGTARTNLGLLSAATHAATDFDTAGAAAAVEGLPLGLTGATQPTRYVGSTTTGAPSSGTFAVGDFVVTADGNVFICTVAGTPGTWKQSGSGTYGTLTQGRLAVYNTYLNGVR